VRKFLERVGGLNPYNEPNYRLVLAQSVMILRGGEWYDWPEGTDIEDQGGIHFSEEKVASEILTRLPGTNLQLRQQLEAIASAAVSEQQPVRIVKEMRWIRRFPNMNGWMLMHWDPPHMYGSRMWWESHRVKGAPDLIVLGPFPEQGGYEQTAEWGTIEEDGVKINSPVLQELPSLSQLELAVEGREYVRNNQQESAAVEWRHLTRLNEFRAQQEAEVAKRLANKKAYIRDKMKPYWANTLEGGRLREELAKRAGMRQHVGN
jgi:hypothetical protein